ncbi:histidine/lysine/arginine/ornithine transporter subunit domain protein, partial [Vibrio parahaemolyticus V-223/04]
LSLLGKC